MYLFIDLIFDSCDEYKGNIKENKNEQAINMTNLFCITTIIKMEPKGLKMGFHESPVMCDD